MGSLRQRAGSPPTSEVGAGSGTAPHNDRWGLKKTELKKLLGKTKEKGFTIVPIKIFFSEKGLAKLEIALAKGKKLYDKRDDLKLKDAKREIDRA